MMSKESGSTNPILRGVIRRLRKESEEEDVDIWADLADRLSRSNRSRAEVNISQLNRYTEEDDTVVVPGKILGSGRLDHPISAAAFDFSVRAQREISRAGGRILSIEELLDENPKGRGVKIME